MWVTKLQVTGCVIDFQGIFKLFAGGQQTLIKQQQFGSLLREEKWDDAVEWKKNMALHYKRDSQCFENGKNLVKKAAAFREKNMLEEAVLYADVASVLFEESNLSSEMVLPHLEICMAEMKETVLAMAGGRSNPFGTDDSIRYIPAIKNYTLPQMRLGSEKLKRHLRPTFTDETLLYIWCLHYIEYCEGLVGEMENQKKTLKKAICLMTTTFSQDACKHRVFGYFHHNLGVMYFKKNKLLKSFERLTIAVKAKSKATDYPNNTEKYSDITRTQTELQKLERTTCPFHEYKDSKAMRQSLEAYGLL